MSKQSEYYRYTKDFELKRRARAAAKRFAAVETQFQLGHLPTEQAHTVTGEFSSLVQADPAAGVRNLLQVDLELSAVAEAVFETEQYNALVFAFMSSLEEKRRICFSGCGSTGRLAMMLEEMWRQYWEDRAGEEPGTSGGSGAVGNRDLENGNLACSIMSGGDRALIKAVENFEDYIAFGVRQVADLKLSSRDLFIAISEGGETSSVLGTVEEALRRGCEVFFLYNNPSKILSDSIERARIIIEDPRVRAMELCSGPMALSGSTRMQATSLEMLVIGAAMDEALLRLEGVSLSDGYRKEQGARFTKLVQELSSEENSIILGELAQKEAEVYEQGGRVTYLTSRFLLDIFSDTTERSPTFMLPPFRAEDDVSAPVSWAFAKDPSRPSAEAWEAMLRRKPRGIDWKAEDYRALGAPEEMINNPPSLGEKEIARYRIGREESKSRSEVQPCWFIQFSVGTIPAFLTEGIDTLALGSNPENLPAKVYKLKITIPQSPILIWHHLAIKLAANIISTATMGIMGRIRGNWMVQLDPTNKKLIDRGSRIIAHLAGVDYEIGCYELFVSIFAREALRIDGGVTTTSPVVDALDRLGNAES